MKAFRKFIYARTNDIQLDQLFGKAFCLNNFFI